MAFLLRIFTPRSIGQHFALTIGAGAGVILIALALASYFSGRDLLLQQTSNEALKEVHDQIHSMDDLVDRMAMLPMAIASNQIANEKAGGVTVPWLASLLEHCPIQAVYGVYMILDDQDWKNTPTFRWVNRKSWPEAARLRYDFHDDSHSWYRGAKEKKGIFVTQPYFAEGGSDIEMISITQPVYDRKGAFIGVAGVDVALDEIRKIVERMHIRELEAGPIEAESPSLLLGRNLRIASRELHESAYLFTTDGTLIVGPDVHKEHPAATAEERLHIRKEIFSTPSGWLRLKDGSGKVLYWAEGVRTGWKLVLEVPYSLIVAPASDLAIQSIVVGGIGLLLLLGVVTSVTRKISGPLRDLQVVASEFEKGSYDEKNNVLARIGKRADELGRFARGFSAMAREIRLREERLSEWNANLELTVKERTADLAHAIKEVEKANKAMEAEIAEAAAYSRAVLPPKLNGPVSTDWVFQTSSQLGGDSFGYHWLDEDHMAIYLLDVCGHGVGAALLSVSVANMLRTASLTETDFLSPASVLSGLNATFPMDRHNDMYFTAWYGVYSLTSHSLRFSCGGHPPAALFTPAGEIVLLATGGMIIGAFSSAHYEESSVNVSSGSQLYLFSDGVYEIDRPGREMLKYDEFLGLLGSAEPSSRIASVVAEVKRQQQSDSFVDDFSLVEFLFLSTQDHSA